MINHHDPSKLEIHIMTACLILGPLLLFLVAKCQGGG